MSMGIAELLLAGFIKGRTKATKQIREEERQQGILADEQAFQLQLEQDKRMFEIQQKELDDLQSLADKENEAMRRAVPGTQNDSLVISQMTRDNNNTKHWSVDRLTGTDEGTKSQQVLSFFTTPSPIRNSSGSFLADTYNLERNDSNNPRFKRSRDSFYNAFALSLKDYVNSAQEKVPTFMQGSPEAQAKLRENTKLKNITPNLQPLLNQVLGQIGDAEDKQDFINQINKSFRTAYGVELVDENGVAKVYKPIFPKDFNEAVKLDEIEVVPQGPQVTLPSNDQSYDSEEVNDKIDYLFQNPYGDPTISKRLDGKGDPITGVSDYDSILGTKFETHHDLKIVEDLIKENKLESRKGAVYITSSGTFKDKQRYEYAVKNLVRNYGIVGATELLDEVLPSSFGNTFGVEEQMINESDAEFEARTSGVVDTKTIEFYQTRGDNIRLAQTSLEDAVELLTTGKAFTGATGAIFTRLMGLFGMGGQFEQMFTMFDAFSGVGSLSDQGITQRIVDNPELQNESFDSLTEGKNLYDEYVAKIKQAQKTDRGKLLQEMYNDTAVLRYLQTEIVYNIARTLENPDGSGARLSRTDIDQMIQGTRLGALLSNKDGMIAMLGYLQTRNNANYQEAKYFSEPANYNDGSKRIAFNMVKSATRFNESSLNQGKVLSTDVNVAIDEVEGLIFRAITEGRQDAKKEGIDLIIEKKPEEPPRTFDQMAFDAISSLFDDDEEEKTPTPSAQENANALKQGGAQ